MSNESNWIRFESLVWRTNMDKINVSGNQYTCAQFIQYEWLELKWKTRIATWSPQKNSFAAEEKIVSTLIKIGRKTGENFKEPFCKGWKKRLASIHILWSIFWKVFIFRERLRRNGIMFFLCFSIKHGSTYRRTTANGFTHKCPSQNF